MRYDKFKNVKTFVFFRYLHVICEGYARRIRALKILRSAQNDDTKILPIIASQIAFNIIKRRIHTKNFSIQPILCAVLSFFYPSAVSSSQMLGTTINAVYTMNPNRIKLIAMITSFGYSTFEILRIVILGC